MCGDLLHRDRLNETRVVIQLPPTATSATHPLSILLYAAFMAPTQ